MGSASQHGFPGRSDRPALDHRAVYVAAAEVAALQSGNRSASLLQRLEPCRNNESPRRSPPLKEWGNPGGRAAAGEAEPEATPPVSPGLGPGASLWSTPATEDAFPHCEIRSIAVEIKKSSLKSLSMLLEPLREVATVVRRRYVLCAAS